MKYESIPGRKTTFDDVITANTSVSLTVVEPSAISLLNLLNVSSSFEYRHLLSTIVETQCFGFKR